MARFSKIVRAMWTDAKFLSLSSPPPSAKFLWIYLLTTPENTSVPGLFIAGEAMLAEALNWPLKAFRKHFDELFRQGMVEADWQARVVYLPNAIKHNIPESPNVIKGWLDNWHEIPECELKHKAWKRFEAFLKDYSEAYHKAFLNSCAEPYRKAMPNQEQEQEQEQDTPNPPEELTGGLLENTTSRKPKSTSILSPGFLRFWSAWPKHHRKQGRSKCESIWRRSNCEPITDHIVRMVEACKKSPDWTKNGGEFIPAPAVWLNQGRWDTDPDDLATIPALPTTGLPENDTHTQAELEAILGGGDA